MYAQKVCCQRPRVSGIDRGAMHESCHHLYISFEYIQLDRFLPFSLPELFHYLQPVCLYQLKAGRLMRVRLQSYRLCCRRGVGGWVCVCEGG